MLHVTGTTRPVRETELKWHIAYGLVWKGMLPNTVLTDMPTVLRELKKTHGSKKHLLEACQFPVIKTMKKCIDFQDLAREE